MDLQSGQPVIISGPTGVVPGRVEYVAAVRRDALPDLGPEAPAGETLPDLLAALHITHAALVSYWFTPASQLMFAALRDEHGADVLDQCRCTSAAAAIAVILMPLDSAARRRAFDLVGNWLELPKETIQ